MPGYRHHDVLIGADLDLAVIPNQDKMKDHGDDFLHLERMYYNVPTIQLSSPDRRVLSLESIECACDRGEHKPLTQTLGIVCVAEMLGLHLIQIH